VGNLGFGKKLVLPESLREPLAASKKEARCHICGQPSSIDKTFGLHKCTKCGEWACLRHIHYGESHKLECTDCKNPPKN
jgi:predicted RNA-binding Zn-ribbon protein involved in translation (DUF1610 family)